MVQNSRRRDDDVDLVAHAARRLEMPPAVAELAARDLRPEPDAPIDTPAPRDALEVGLNLAPRRVDVAELRVRREGVAVEVRRHVAGDSRIRVLAPGAAEAVRLLVDHHVAVPGLLEPNGGEDARHAGADDREAQ